MSTNRRYTREEIASFFEAGGCELLEETYQNAHQPLAYRCGKCGTVGKIRWNSFQNGQRCGACSGTRRLTIDKVRKAYEDKGCVLLESEYKNNRTPMRYRCSCGQEDCKSFDHFQRASSCSACGVTCRLTQEEVESVFREQGCELLDDYRNNSQQLRFRCKCGREEAKRFLNFKVKPHCTHCSKRKRYTLEDARKLFENGGCKLLSENVSFTRDKLNYICSCGSEAVITLGKFLAGQRCSACGIRSGDKSGMWNPDRELVELNAKLASRSLSRLKMYLKSQGLKKTDRHKNLMGYSIAELRERITGHENWLKVKDGKWHIDHIFPIKAFIENGITDLKVINALDNLQPLAASVNLSKGGRYDKSAFRAYLASKGHVPKDSSAVL